MQSKRATSGPFYKMAELLCAKAFELLVSTFKPCRTAPTSVEINEPASLLWPWSKVVTQQNRRSDGGRDCSADDAGIHPSPNNCIPGTHKISPFGQSAG